MGNQDPPKFRIMKNFVAYGQHEQTTNRKNCWKNCHVCETPWRQLETTFLHYAYIRVKVEAGIQYISRFICDDCLDTKIPEDEAQIEVYQGNK